MTIQIQTKAWTGRNGQIRHYVQNLGQILEHVYGNELSIRDWERADHAKIWVGTDGEVHVDSWPMERYYGMKSASMVAYIREHLSLDAVQAAEEARDAVQVVHSTAYGRGIRYADTSGATYYQGSDGRYSVQIWDEA